ncbi:aldolase [Salipiger aestuarii]|uniref:Citrate lyase subunit beta/citryl-CoA lyase n=1 Tax=Salipiger aestuarii TaxID=568098 RepID=A0A327Y0S3_9RHOB|nr:CoA ester lyase [Salipiger aestuarii]EIE49969.1 HpcH/HpaI aldolase [Citreicella sp. 357]KAA8605623.1 aldolase [Salipiger aestuarii]KAA8608230.1 aldolase [Salipiger aestuarii]KAB2539807.1 aldolase [Salipiger aestuarii]RAK12009.1 citrate lyase subunit beta/citryl-CoA lyase [Salipiger aestuarii]
MVDLTALRAPLFVPANRPDRFAKAAASGACAVILDLEDAVDPGAKEAARAALSCDFTELPVIVRINPAGTPWHDADLDAVTALRCAAVMLPKAEDPARIATIAARTGHAILALIETARGLSRARDIAAQRAVTRLAFGSIDFCADLGCDHDRDTLRSVRLELVLAARLAGLAAPLDGVTTDLTDLAITEDDTRHARSLGMTGKLCIHPRQVAPVRRGFAPTGAELDWAARVLASGDGAVAVDGAMVDAPVRQRARMILAQRDGS